MTVGEPGPELRALKQEADEPSPPSAPTRRRTDEPGLGSLHATLDRLVTTLDLRSLTVVIDDSDLGRQAFRAGPGPFEPGTLAGRPGCRADPELAPERLDGDLLVQLCATSLRLELERAEAPGAQGVDVAEVALRRLPGVHAVVVERDGDLMVVQVHAALDAPPDLARAAAHATAPLADTRLVVEVMRDVSEPPPAATPVPLTAAPTEIVAVRNDPSAGEVEVHVRHGEVRTIGRAPMAQGLAGAATATLEAFTSVDFERDLTLGWVRTIETTAQRRFVVAVSLLHAGTRASRHGLGAGTSPIEAAARATLDALTRPDTVD